MEKGLDFRQLEQILLFYEMDEEEITAGMEALSAQVKKYRKGSVILHAGDNTSHMGIVLSGSVTIESNDMWGNCTILSHVGKNGFFAETYALMKDTVLPVDVRANEDCRILFLSIGKLRQLPSSDSWHTKMISNLLTISSRKNLTLSGRSFHTAPKTIRGRILSYLNTISLQEHAKEFDIPFDRQQLADYLNVERTALSKELGKMRKDGIIRCRRNHFVLLK